LEAAKRARINLIRKITQKLTEDDIDAFVGYEPRAYYDELSTCVADDLDTASLLAKYHV
jgi:hypothetical protein